jgi:hypothetical protein
MGIALGAFVVASVLGQTLGTGAASMLRGTQPPASSARAPGSGLAAKPAALSAPSSSGTPTDEATERAREAVSAAVESCRLANLRQQAALTTAAVSISQWDEHIQAMNQLVAGKITISAARNFWEATRIGATEHAAAFHIADDTLGAQGATCTQLDAAQSAAASRQQSAALVTCRKALAARGPILAQARTGISMWEHHIHMMEMFRSGEITPSQAAAAWLEIWKAGDRQLKSYRAAVAAAGPSCSLS